jgi:predicted AAA+ superfamily ATPase
MPRLLSLLASRVTALVNISELSNNLKIPQTTLKRYITLLETTFLVKFLPAWAANIGKRMIKTPKLLLSDTGLLSYLLGVSSDSLDKQQSLVGPLVENFVAMEFYKQITWSLTAPGLYHFRTAYGEEVDFVLEDRKGRIVAVEVKAGETVVSTDFQTIRKLVDAVKKKFHRGIVLYAGSEVIAFGEKLHAVPIQALWSRN